MPTFELTKHRELWNWLADNPGNKKTAWPGWGEVEDWCNDIYPDNNCFACEYVHELLSADGDREYPLCGKTCRKLCPLLWPKDKTCCEGGHSLYSSWCHMTNSGANKFASAFARQIAELPVREGVETI